MDHENHNGCIGHPITNLLMATACAADLGTADHVDHGAVVELENGGVLTMTRRAANIELPGTAGPAEPEPEAVDVDQMTRIEQKLDNLLVTLVRHLAGAQV